jgi:predicted HD phosphohydrolase
LAATKKRKKKKEKLTPVLRKMIFKSVFSRLHLEGKNVLCVGTDDATFFAVQFPT